MSAVRRVFSAIQPTGAMHVGNYLGAIRNWVNMTKQPADPQSRRNFVFSIADLHALTVPAEDPSKLRQDTLHLAATLLACGLDPSKCILYQQSSVAQHAELNWILSCNLAKNRLTTMTQYKDKVRKGAQPYLGLFTYPVLMTADILLYRSTHVPVGDDQTQHLELARDVAASFNRKFSIDFFPIPEQLKATFGRVMSLRDANAKMSKSEASDASRINLVDSSDQIFAKIKRAKTDLIPQISFDPASRPDVSNLVNLYSEFSGMSTDQVVELFENKDFVTFKRELSELVISSLGPIRSQILALEADQSHVAEVLRTGASEAREIAEVNMVQVKEIVGLHVI